MKSDNIKVVLHCPERFGEIGDEDLKKKIINAVLAHSDNIKVGGVFDVEFGNPLRRYEIISFSDVEIHLKWPPSNREV